MTVHLEYTAYEALVSVWDNTGLHLELSISGFVI